MINQYVKEVVNKYSEQVEQLTKVQFEDALIGAIKSGDFVRHVQGFHIGEQKQGMTYIPFREKEYLKLKIEKLKRLILLTDESVSGEVVGDLTLKQWNSFIEAFPDEGGE